MADDGEHTADRHVCDSDCVYRQRFQAAADKLAVASKAIGNASTVEIDRHYAAYVIAKDNFWWARQEYREHLAALARER